MKVSVIVPVYNKIRYLDELYECLSNQQLRSFECILVNDGSTDGSDAICDHMAELDVRFKVIHLKNSGVSHARNKGLSIARGDYITFVDSDDTIPENYLAVLYNSITTSKADIAICSITKVCDNGKGKRIPLPKQGVHSVDELISSFANCQKETGIYGYCCGKIFSRTQFEQVRFNEALSLAEDFDFFLNLYARSSKILFTEQTTYYYRQETENSSAIVDDSKINYRAQLDINLHYRTFLQQKNAYTNENRQIVSRILCNYVFFVWFHCSLDVFKSSFEELRQVCQQKDIELAGETVLQKWFFFLLQTGQMRLARLTLQLYRQVRRILKGRR